MAYLIGADPELFVRNGGAIVSGHLFPCGTKTAPRETPHGAVQVDGIALEFNVIPSSTREAFLSNLNNVLSDLNKIVADVMPGSFLEATPVADVGVDFLSTLPKLNRELGCNPDYNAYFLDTNPTPQAELPFRTGSGHIHVGFCEPDERKMEDYDHFEKGAAIARQLDFFLGLPSLKWDPDNRRRELYGKAGAFRPKPYGMEYRVLSNKWVGDNDLTGFIFDQTQHALYEFDRGNVMIDKYGLIAHDSINSGSMAWQDNKELYSEVMYSASR